MKARSILWLAMLALWVCFAFAGENCFSSASSTEQDFVSQIQSLEDALSSHPQNSSIEKRLAQAYFDYGVYLKGQKRIVEATEYAQMAQNLGASRQIVQQTFPEVEAGKGALGSAPGATQTGKPSIFSSISQKTVNPDSFLFKKAMIFQLLQDGMKAYKEKNYELTQERMKQVLEYESDNKYAHELLGDVNYQLQNLEAAEEHWKASASSGNMNRVKKKLEKVTKEIPVEKGLKAAEEEHFLIRYDQSLKEYSTYDIKTLLRGAYRAVYRDLGIPLAGKTTVILYDEQAFNQAIKPNHWSGALFDGKIRIPVEEGIERDPAKARRLERLLRHELAHVFVHEIGGVATPLWLHEGVAQYEESKLSPIYIGDFLNAFEKGKIYSMKQLEGGEKLLSSDGAVFLFYQQSYLMVTYLVQKYGLYKIKELLKSIGKGDSQDSALLLVYNLAPDELGKDFSSWAKANL
ncbi:MAG: hypothetical protein HY586_04495 [Candidatus Omnitrophica bacterium]|nr:hypothetical protein [Candidatus Omnitrophota bacterium]